MEKLTPERRSENMRRITSKHTKPEVFVRRLLHRLGFRYRLHCQGLPGKPDLVFRGRKKVIFVHGCFWHLHADCREGRIPSSRREYWEPKLRGNRKRDQNHLDLLAAAGWSALVIWECEIQDVARLESRLTGFLS